MYKHFTKLCDKHFTKLCDNIIHFVKYLHIYWPTIYVDPSNFNDESTCKIKEDVIVQQPLLHSYVIHRE